MIKTELLIFYLIRIEDMHLLPIYANFWLMPVFTRGTQYLALGPGFAHTMC